MTNEEMDVAVFEAVKSGKTRAAAVQAHMKLNKTPEARRFVDSSLQRLRKVGKIVFENFGPVSSKGWHVAKRSAPTLVGHVYEVEGGAVGDDGLGRIELTVPKADLALYPLGTRVRVSVES